MSEQQSNEALRILDPKAREEFHKLPFEKKEKSLNSKSFILYPFEVHFKQAEPFEVKLEESKRLIKNHLKMFKRVFVSTSYGMDSTVLMSLVIDCVHELNAEGYKVEMPEFWLNNTLNIYKEEPEYWKQMNKFFGIEDKFRMFTPPKDEKGNRYTVWSIAKKFNHLPHFRYMHGKKSRKSKAESDDANGGLTPECCDILKKKTIKDYLKSIPKGERFDCHFVGTRAEESRMRKLGVMQRCRSYLIKHKWPYPIRAVTPMSFWLKADVYQYYALKQIPKNPTYAIHNLERMGCASCPAHKNWEIRLASDPTNEGRGMLKQNLTILRNTQPNRYEESIALLKKHNLVPELIAELEGEKTLLSYPTVPKEEEKSPFEVLNEYHAEEFLPAIEKCPTCECTAEELRCNTADELHDHYADCGT